MDRLGELLVRKCGIPLVMAKRRDGAVKAWNRRGEFMLPRDRAEVFGADHPFLKELAGDFIKLMHHEDSGDFVINGWDPVHHPISFPSENGAHAGPGREETHGFVILPADSPFVGKKYLRPTDLRRNVLHFIEARERSSGGKIRSIFC